MTSFLKEATADDVPQIVDFLIAMQEELRELVLDPGIVTKSIEQSLKENVHWFLFLDEDEKPFGTCYLQSLHNYWQKERRYYLGTFYITQNKRGAGRFREIKRRLEEWARAHEGVQIYAHIHQDNAKSLGAFASVGLEKCEYALCVHHWGKD